MVIVTITEKQGITLDIAFHDTYGSIITPSTITYNVKDIASDTFTVNPTPVDPDTSITVDIVSDDNVILDRENNKERRVFTILWTYNNGLGGSKEFHYTIKRLAGLT